LRANDADVHPNNFRFVIADSSDGCATALASSSHAAYGGSSGGLVVALGHNAADKAGLRPRPSQVPSAPQPSVGATNLVIGPYNAYKLSVIATLQPNNLVDIGGSDGSVGVQTHFGISGSHPHTVIDPNVGNGSLPSAGKHGGMTYIRDSLAWDGAALTISQASQAAIAASDTVLLSDVSFLIAPSELNVDTFIRALGAPGSVVFNFFSETAIRAHFDVPQAPGAGAEDVELMAKTTVGLAFVDLGYRVFIKAGGRIFVSSSTYGETPTMVISDMNNMTQLGPGVHITRPAIGASSGGDFLQIFSTFIPYYKLAP
jgi:hypothetical protein